MGSDVHQKGASRIGEMTRNKEEDQQKRRVDPCQTDTFLRLMNGQSSRGRKRTMSGAASWLVLLFLRRVSSSDVSAWYLGRLPSVPDYVLTPLSPVNLIGKPIRFTCSALGEGDLFFRWNVSRVVVHSSITRALAVQAGRDLTVRDSYIELLSQVAHRGTVQCSIFRRASLQAQLSADYDVRDTLGDCDQYCSERSTCVVDGELGSTCVCEDGYPHRDFFHGVCYAGSHLQAPCLFAHECIIAGSSCQRGTCKCSYLRVRSNGSCVPVATLNEPCGGLIRCVSRNAACSGGRCRCLPGLRQMDGLCLAEEAKPARRMRAPYNVTGTLIGAFVICVTVAFAFYIFVMQRYRKTERINKSLESDEARSY